MRIVISISKIHARILSALLFILIVGISADYVSSAGTLVQWHPLSEISADGGATSIDSKINITSNGNITLMGNVGIGTNNPQAKLDVAGDIQTSGRIITTGLLKGDADNNGVIDMRDVVYIQKAFLSFPGYACTVAICDINNDGIVNALDTTLFARILAGLSNPYSYFSVDSQAAIRSSSSVYTDTNNNTIINGLYNGNVGIGTANPGSAKLNVSGNISVSGAGNGIHFPDGSVQTSAASGGVSLQCTTVTASYVYGGACATCPIGYNVTGGGISGACSGPDSWPSGDTTWCGKCTYGDDWATIYARCCKLGI